MLTSDEMREQAKQWEPKSAPLVAYEVYCLDFGESPADSELLRTAAAEHAAEEYVRKIEKRDSFRPQDVDAVTVKVRDVLGDRKWRTFVVEPRLSVSYTVKEKT